MTELQQLQHDFTELQGQIVGALAMLKLLAGVITLLCGAVIGLCTYVFVKLSRAHELLERRVHKVELAVRLR